MNDLPRHPKSTGGFNPMRWKCEGGGNCYLEKGHLRKENFFDCFPDKIAVSDIDMVVEVSGKFFFAEWKPKNGVIEAGQERLLMSLGKCKDEFGSGFVVFLIYGNSQTLEVDRAFRYKDGRKFKVKVRDLPDLRRGFILFSTEARK